MREVAADLLMRSQRIYVWARPRLGQYHMERGLTTADQPDRSPRRGVARAAPQRVSTCCLSCLDKVHSKRKAEVDATCVTYQDAS